MSDTKSKGLLVKISADISKLKEELEKGKKETQEFSKSAKEHFADFEESVGAANELASKALAGIGVAMAGAVAAIAGLTTSTEEYRQNQAQLNAAFEQAKLSTESATGVYKQLYRVIGDDDQTVESAANIAMLADSEEEAAKWAELAAGVLGTFHDTLQPEAFYEAANETMKLGEASGAFAQMLEQTGVMAVDEFNKKLAACNTEAEKQALMLSVSQNAMGAAGDAYNKATKSIQDQREAQANLNDMLATLGEALQPVMTMLTKLSTEVLADLVPKIETFVDNNGAELAELLGKIAEVVGNVLGFIADNWAVIAGLGGAIAAIAAAVQIVNAALAIYNTMQALANAQMLIAVAVIAAIIAVIVLLVVYWDDIANACANAAEAIKQGWSDMGEWFAEIGEKIKKAFADIGSWFGDKFTEAKNGVKKAWSDMGAWIGDVKTSITNKFNDIGSWFRNKFTEAKNGVQGAFNSIGSWFGNIKTNITNSFSNIGTWFGSKFTDAVNRIKNAFNSIPSFFGGIFSRIQTIFTDVGAKISQGLTDGVKRAVNAVVSKAVDVINAAIAGINGAIKFINMIPGVNVSTISEMSAPRLAKGGIIDTATLAVVGEAGKEAVVPLENNLGWLDKLATMLNDRIGGSNTPVVLTIDGRVLGEATIQNINNITKQKGSMQLILG